MLYRPWCAYNDCRRKVFADDRSRSRRVAIVISQQATKSLTALNFAFGMTNFVTGSDDLILQPLMVAFLVVMVEIHLHCLTERLVSEEDDSGETLGFDTEVESFEV